MRLKKETIAELKAQRDMHKAVQAMRNIRLEWKEGYLTPFVEQLWYEQDFKKSLYIDGVENYVEMYRILNEYTLRDLEMRKNLDDPIVWEWIKDERMLQLVLDSYGKTKRKDPCHLAVEHVIGVSNILAALQVPRFVRRAGTGHDLIEDTFDPTMPEMTYRLRQNPADGSPFYFKEFWRNTKNLDYSKPEDRESASHVVKSMAQSIAENIGERESDLIVKVTRMPWTEKASSLSELYYEYARYLVPINQDMWASFLKPADALYNLWSIGGIRDSGARLRTLEGYMIKAGLPLDRLRLYCFIVKELLIMEIAKNAVDTKFEGIDECMRKIRPEQRQKFKERVAIVPYERAFNKPVLKSGPDSGMPVVIIYGEPKTYGTFEIELPFMNELLATELVATAMGKKAQNIRVEKSLLPYNLKYATIVAFEAYGSDLYSDKTIKELGETYDAVLTHVNIIPNFDRAEWHDASHKNEWTPAKDFLKTHVLRNGGKKGPKTLQDHPSIAGEKNLIKKDNPPFEKIDLNSEDIIL